MEIENTLDTDNELDDTWITSFEKMDELYKDYYVEDVKSINIICVYINTQKEVEKIVKNKYILKNANILSREELIDILKKYFSTKYNSISLLTYNIDVQPTQIHSFLKNSSNFHPKDNLFFTTIQKIETIFWKPTINLFQDLNELFLFAYETNKKHSTNLSNKTKRIHMGHSKKTIKKKYNYHFIY